MTSSTEADCDDDDSEDDGGSRQDDECSDEPRLYTV